MLALKNAPIGMFCNARMLHLALKCGENTFLKFRFAEVTLVFSSFCAVGVETNLVLERSVSSDNSVQVQVLASSKLHFYLMYCYVSFVYII